MKQRVARILLELHAGHADAKVELDHRNPFQLLVATILSAQCTDQRVNQVTPGSFAGIHAVPTDFRKRIPATGSRHHTNRIL